ncbi:hypothetical protein HPB50_009702 [Hyalomma asiaticum]|uniref:Uncharacterized protein n=1 Tax=Hyalomma asiaticum TaxID=266040 RepID=A0ACB7THV2_HYAAI|nr:hypothetical protein HPB50_009702 [Hyalomma asiaticum]
MDKRIEEKLGTQPVKRIYMYVDDFLVILEDIPSDQLNQAISNIIGVFNSESGGLRSDAEIEGQDMDLSMEEFIKVLTMGHPELLEDSDIQQVFDKLKKAMPHFIKPATFQELKEAECAAKAAQERYVAASMVVSALNNIQLLCYGDEDGPQPLIDKKHLPEIESVQAAIILSEDPIGRILGREELHLDQAS